MRKQKAEAVKRWRERHPEKYRQEIRRRREIERKILKTLGIIKKDISRKEGIKIKNRADMFRILYYYFYTTRYNSKIAKKKLEEMGFKLSKNRF